MTPIFFLLMYAIGSAMALFKHPIYGIYTYLFTFYMSPSHSWWGDEIPGIRYMFIIACITLISSLRSEIVEGRPKWLEYPAAKLFLAMVVWMWCQYIWALNREIHLEGTIEYTKHLIVFYLIYRIFNTKEKLIGFLMAHIIGCFWFGYQALDASGGRLESIGGPVGGANELGMHISTAMITGGILWMLLSGWRKWVIFLAIPFIVNTIILTVSRGAFLGFFAGGIVGGMFIPRFYRGKYIGLGILALILISFLAHDQLLDRFAATIDALTGEEEQLDNSANSRFDIFAAGMQMGKDYPLGAGYRGTRILSPYYMDKSLLSERSGGRSAHNTFAAVFAEHGYVGVVIYLSLIFWTLKTLFWFRRIGDHVMSKEDRAFGVAVIAALVGMWISGNFSNNLFTETQYWLLAILCSHLACTVGVKRSFSEEKSRKNRNSFPTSSHGFPPGTHHVSN